MKGWTLGTTELLVNDIAAVLATAMVWSRGLVTERRNP